MHVFVTNSFLNQLRKIKLSALLICFPLLVFCTWRVVFHNPSRGLSASPVKFNLAGTVHTGKLAHKQLEFLELSLQVVFLVAFFRAK